VKFGALEPGFRGETLCLFVVNSFALPFDRDRFPSWIVDFAMGSPPDGFAGVKGFGRTF
jgi:hypothetical protein